MKVKIVIDVEMCLVQKSYEWKDYPYEHEIIQIGAVMMNEAYEMVDEYSSFVHPQYGRIDHFIRKLTGISEKDIVEAPSLEEVLRQMLAWIGSREAVFYSWSITDFRQISREVQAKGMDETEMALFLDKENWVDYQPEAGRRFDKRWRLALEDALMLAEVEPEGKQHDGLVDARNTARLIAKMEMNPDSRFLQDRLQEEKNDAPLGTSLGSLLKNLSSGTH